MRPRQIGMSEARRLLPEIAAALERDGGRVDVTYRGHPRVSIVRTADLGAAPPSGATARSAALRVEFEVPAEDMVKTIRALRSRVGQARKLPESKPRHRPSS
jgi:hypothetical protein